MYILKTLIYVLFEIVIEKGLPVVMQVFSGQILDNHTGARSSQYPTRVPLLPDEVWGYGTQVGPTVLTKDVIPEWIYRSVTWVELVITKHTVSKSENDH